MNSLFFKKLILFSITTLLVVLTSVAANAQNDMLIITSIDVGEGNSYLVQTPGGKNILIDGSGKDRVLHVAKLFYFIDKKGILFKLDELITTYSDPKHINDLCSRLGINKTMMRRCRPNAGGILDWGKGVKAKILYSDTDSMIIKITYGQRSFLLAGSVEPYIQRRVTSSLTKELPSDYLYIGPCETPPSPLFLNAVRPGEVIFSGYPTPTVLDRLEKTKWIKHIYRVDQAGTTSIRTTGTTD